MTKKINFSLFDPFNSDQFEKSNSFHEITSISSFEKKSKKKFPKAWIQINYKSYPRLPQIILPNIKPKSANLFELLYRRASIRNYAKKSIKLDDLSVLLKHSCGIKYFDDNWNRAYRFYPSAGARYPIEVYIIVNNVDGLKRGLYHYNVKNDHLEQLLVKDLRKESKRITNQKIAKNSAINIIITGVMNRNRIKYGDRGYRYILIEAGHVAQNFYLNSGALNLGCCAIGGYMDNDMDKLLDIEYSQEKTIYILTIGAL